METILSHCTALFSQHGGLFAVFFLGGLTGGFTHCLAMCGPIVASESLGCSSRCTGSCGRKQVVSRALGVPYHLGRMVTYGALGFVVALFSQQVASFSFWPTLSTTMLVVAGVMFLASSLPGCVHRWLRPSGALTFTRGALLGFMPCGLIYAALMMAATLANPPAGMVAMWLFVLGTVPALLVASVGAEFLTQRWRGFAGRAGRVMMACNGLLLLAMAAQGVKV
jgi:sulfite exporter TauE/SafE